MSAPWSARTGRANRRLPRLRVPRDTARSGLLETRTIRAQRRSFFAGRYAETVGSSLSPNLQGRSAACRSPTRGPVLNRSPADGASGSCIVSGLSRRSRPLWDRSIPRALHSRAGPRARPGVNPRKWPEFYAVLMASREAHGLEPKGDPPRHPPQG